MQRAPKRCTLSSRLLLNIHAARGGVNVPIVIKIFLTLTRSSLGVMITWNQGNAVPKLHILNLLPHVSYFVKAGHFTVHIIILGTASHVA